MTMKFTRIISLTLLCAAWAGLAHAADTIRIAYSSVNPHALLVSLAEKRGLYAKYGSVLRGGLHSRAAAR